ncbi:hypothetical protein RD055328_12290 [Companilactobacillus sp. RD055328]|uniref:WxL domain-containing protein n=1 Tax=Companilactobacillus sp. RD055328 TaxID=2916634 RepID=UPI001FC85BE0|nr:WxL domain-containing protein [Companilactobacillus sp. RD055328]GKQ43306.1 hypothetical protein RD055328_12290 [Companilactobacillus sp. RD055328]
MKKMTLTTAALLAVLATSTTTTSVFAEDVAVPEPAHSKGHVIVDPDDGETKPVDPTDPGTGNKGPLSLDNVPSFDFDHVKIGGTASNDTLNEHLQTSDKRGTGAGWTVNVKYVGAQGDKAKNEAWATLADGESAWTATVDGAEVKGQGFVFNMTEFAPVTVDGATVSYNEGAAPTTGISIANVSNVDQKIAEAGKDAGMGTWVQAEATAATLTVPGNNKAGDYTANLEWSIVSAPQG